MEHTVDLRFAEFCLYNHLVVRYGERMPLSRGLAASARHYRSTHQAATRPVRRSGSLAALARSPARATGLHDPVRTRQRRRNGFENLPPRLEITQKNSRPAHTPTQGKIERFHQTLKRWLATREPAATLQTLKDQLNAFQRVYTNNARTGPCGDAPRRDLCRSSEGHPGQRRRQQHWRIRFDTVDPIRQDHPPLRRETPPPRHRKTPRRYPDHTPHHRSGHDDHPPQHRRGPRRTHPDPDRDYQPRKR
ncbi:integrase core domain-containing protein [Microbacterium sp. NPDC058342]|uniref:integrase core domain-containing protein n=1 Tax=Microbacterium sp. NPDC058342 TaxID=3346454 RepID=UPI00365E235C